MSKNKIIMKSEEVRPLTSVSVKLDRLKEISKDPEEWAKLLEFLKEKFNFYITEGLLFKDREMKMTVDIDVHLMNIISGQKSAVIDEVCGNMQLHTSIDARQNRCTIVLEKHVAKEYEIDMEEYVC